MCLKYRWNLGDFDFVIFFDFGYGYFVLVKIIRSGNFRCNWCKKDLGRKLSLGWKFKVFFRY